MLNAVSELEQELAPGERLLWSGQPLQGLRFRGVDLFLIPFSVLWLGFALVWQFKALTTPEMGKSGMHIIFFLFGLPFVLLGLYMLIGRFVGDVRKRARTAYGITNQRILCVTRRGQRRVRSLDLANLSDVELIERPDRSGSIRFLSSGAPAYAKTGREHRVAIQTGEVFELLPRVREAYDVLQQARRK